jgi:hypothetical protein
MSVVIGIPGRQRPGDVLSHLPHFAGVDAVDVLLLLPHVTQRALDPGVAAGELPYEPHPARGEDLHPLVRRVGARLHLGAHLLHELSPLRLRRADPLLADLAPSLFEVLELFQGVVLLQTLRHVDHLHDRLYEPLGRDLLPRAKASRDLLQAVAEPPLQLDPLFEPRQVELYHPLRRHVGTIQILPDLPQGEPQGAQGFDPLQPDAVAGGVEPVPPFGAAGRREQADLVVVAESSHGQPRPPGELAHLPRYRSRIFRSSMSNISVHGHRVQPLVA